MMENDKSSIGKDYEAIVDQAKKQPGVAAMLEMLEVIRQPKEMMDAYAKATKIPVQYISTPVTKAL